MADLTLTAEEREIVKDARVNISFLDLVDLQTAVCALLGVIPETPEILMRAGAVGRKVADGIRGDHNLEEVIVI